MNVIKAKVVLHWETNGNDEGINTYNLFMPPLLWDKFKQLVQTNSDLMEQEFPNLKTAKATAPLQAKCISDFHDYMRVFENELGREALG